MLADYFMSLMWWCSSSFPFSCSSDNAPILRLKYLRKTGFHISQAFIFMLAATMVMVVPFCWLVVVIVASPFFVIVGIFSNINTVHSISYTGLSTNILIANRPFCHILPPYPLTGDNIVILLSTHIVRFPITCLLYFMCVFDRSVCIGQHETNGDNGASGVKRGEEG